MLARLSMALSPDLIQHIDSEVLDTLVIESPEARLERLGPKANQPNPTGIAQQVRIGTSLNPHSLTNLVPGKQ